MALKVVQRFSSSAGRAARHSACSESFILNFCVLKNAEVSAASAGQPCAGIVLQTLAPVSRLLIRSLLTWLSAISALSSASSSSCWSLRNLPRWTFACSSCWGERVNVTPGGSWRKDRTFPDLRLPPRLSCRIWFSAAVYRPGPGVWQCSCGPPQSGR